MKREEANMKHEEAYMQHEEVNMILQKAYMLIQKASVKLDGAIRLRSEDYQLCDAAHCLKGVANLICHRVSPLR